MEYLMTYGWALLVIVIVIAILLIINPFSAPQGCRFDDLGFTCANPVVNTAGGLFMRLTNNQNTGIVLTSVVCTTDKSPTAPPYSPIYAVPIARQGYIDLEGDVTCETAGGTVLTPGQEFSAKVWIFYNTEDEYGKNYPAHTASASFVTKVGA